MCQSKHTHPHTHSVNLLFLSPGIFCVPPVTCLATHIPAHTQLAKAPNTRVRPFPAFTSPSYWTYSRGVKQTNSDLVAAQRAEAQGPVFFISGAPSCREGLKNSFRVLPEMVSHQLIARLNYNCTATPLFLSVSQPERMCRCLKVQQQVETSSLCKWLPFWMLPDCGGTCSYATTYSGTHWHTHAHTRTRWVMRNMSWSLSSRVSRSLTHEMIIGRKSSFDTKRWMLLCVYGLMSACLCNVSYCGPDGSPWRPVTYNQDMVGGFGFLGCWGRVEREGGEVS